MSHPEVIRLSEAKSIMICDLLRPKLHPRYAQLCSGTGHGFDGVSFYDIELQRSWYFDTTYGGDDWYGFASDPSIVPYTTNLKIYTHGVETYSSFAATDMTGFLAALAACIDVVDFRQDPQSPDIRATAYAIADWIEGVVKLVEAAEKVLAEQENTPA